ncbi:hypothetical protein IAR50_005048 [Cryptococcus sp. DSM 104548]
MQDAPQATPPQAPQLNKAVRCSKPPHQVSPKPKPLKDPKAEHSRLHRTAEHGGKRMAWRLAMRLVIGESDDLSVSE